MKTDFGDEMRRSRPSNREELPSCWFFCAQKQVGGIKPSEAAVVEGWRLGAQSGAVVLW